MFFYRSMEGKREKGHMWEEGILGSGHYADEAVSTGSNMFLE